MLLDFAVQSAAESTWQSATGWLPPTARVPQHLLLLLFLAPQIGERVDDDTENQAQNDNDYHDEEEQVVDDSRSERGFLQTARPLIIVNDWNTHTHWNTSPPKIPASLVPVKVKAFE